MNTIQRIDNLNRHIERVRNDCYILGCKLVNEGMDFEGKELVNRGNIHDSSKFTGLEWDALFQTDDEELLKAAVYQHNRSNRHHPEFHNGIKNMGCIDLAECVTDWHARSSEFGSSLLEWIAKDATSRFAFNTKDKVYKDIKYFVNLLLDKPFKRLK